MDIFVVTGTHFSQPTEITRYRATAHEADVAATALVNLLRADLDPEALPPVEVSGWQSGLVGAQRRQLEALGLDFADLDPEVLAVQAGFDVWVDRAEIQGLSPLIVDDRELCTILAALHGYQWTTPDACLLSIATDGDRHAQMSKTEIDALCDRLNSDVPRQQEANVLVEVGGGMVQGIIADQSINLRVVDYDVDGADPENLVTVPGEDGDPVLATVSGWAVESICIDPDRIARLVDALGPGE